MVEDVQTISGAGDQPTEDAQASLASGDESSQPAKGVSRRLVADLNKRSAADLAWLVETEGANRTVVVNRAIQVLAMLMEAQYQGQSIALVDNASGKGEVIRFVF